MDSVIIKNELEDEIDNVMISYESDEEQDLIKREIVSHEDGICEERIWIKEQIEKTKLQSVSCVESVYKFEDQIWIEEEQMEPSRLPGQEEQFLIKKENDPLILQNNSSKEDAEKKSDIFTLKSEIIIEPDEYSRIREDIKATIVECFYCSRTYLTLKRLRHHIKYCRIKTENIEGDIINSDQKTSCELWNSVSIGIYNVPNKGQSEVECYYCRRTCLTLPKLRHHLKCHIKSGNIEGDEIKTALKSCITEFSDINRSFLECNLDKGQSHQNLQYKHSTCKYFQKTNFIRYLFLEYDNKLKESNFCGYKDNTTALLYQHLQAHHEIKNFSCSYCSRKYVRKSSLRRHLLTNHTALSCNYCSHKFNRKKYLTRHILSKHNMGEQQFFFCYYCSYKSIQKRNLRRHILLNHTGFPCRYCSYTYVQKKNLKRHILTKHNGGEESFCCYYCSFKSLWKRSIRRHLLTNHAGLSCLYCSCKFDQKKNLIRHILLKHNTGERSFSCYYCSYKSIQKRNLKRHILIKHTGFPCRFCSYTYVQKKYLRRHILTKHRTFYCRYCSYKTIQKNDLIRHILSKHNSGENSFFCYYCSFKSIWKGSLRRHILSKHAGLSCHYCLYKFDQKKNLTRHILSKHNKGKKPFICYYCSYKSFQKRNLGRHILFKHKGLPCRFCPCTYVNTKNLRGHSLTKQNTGEKSFSDCYYCSYKNSQKRNLK